MDDAKPYVPLNKATYDAKETSRQKWQAARDKRATPGNRQDPNTGRWRYNSGVPDATSRLSLGFHCLNKMVVPTKDGAEGLADCGQCGPCRAERANDQFGRMMGSAASAVETRFDTYTLRPGEEDRWRGDEVKRLHQRMRDFCERQGIPCPQFFWIGERGDENGRRHYHAMWCWSVPCPFPVSAYRPKWDRKRRRFDGEEPEWIGPRAAMLKKPRKPKIAKAGRYATDQEKADYDRALETWRVRVERYRSQLSEARMRNLWRLGGWSSERVQTVVGNARYVAQYAAKGRDAGREVPRASFSVRRILREDGTLETRALGWEAAREHGERYARAGLNLPSWMPIPGTARYDERGVLHDQKMELKGSLARTAILGFKDEHARRVASGVTTRDLQDVLKHSPLFRRFDPDYVEPIFYDDEFLADRAARTAEWEAECAARFDGAPPPPPRKLRAKRRGLHWLPRGAPMAALRPKPKLGKADRSAHYMVRDEARGRLIAMLEMVRTGFVCVHVEPGMEGYVLPKARRFKRGSHAGAYALRDIRSLRGTLDLGDEAHDAIAAWMAERRGPEWEDLQAWHAEKGERLREYAQALRKVFHPRTMLGRAARAYTEYLERSRDGPALWALSLEASERSRKASRYSSVRC